MANLHDIPRLGTTQMDEAEERLERFNEWNVWLSRPVFPDCSPLFYWGIVGLWILVACFDPKVVAGASAIWQSFLGSVPSLLYGLKLVTDS